VRPSSHGKAVLLALALATVLTGTGGCGASPTPGSAQPTAASAGNAGNATAALDSLTVAPNGSMSGYSRDKFTHWIGQGDGCDTRDVVLKRDGKNVKATTDCKITSGSWYSPYDDKTVTDPQDIDIDHMVPLAAGWRSGASKWTDEQRKQFANDLSRPQLFAVSLQSNRAKGDQDPSTWKPPNRAYWCTYAQNWITVKSYYKLTVTQAEKSGLADMLATCK
jgi:hypothetical protein